MNKYILVISLLLVVNIGQAQWNPTTSTNFVTTSHASGTNDYALNLETSGSNPELFIENNVFGGNRQAFYFGHSNGTPNIFGISTSSNSGGSWNPRFTVSQNGRIGIGTSTPYNLLDIGSAFSFHDGGHKVIGLGYAPGGGGTSLLNGYSSELRLDPTTGLFSIGMASGSVATGAQPQIVNRLTIRNSTGNVGIGTNAPSERLTVSGNALVEQKIITNHGVGSDGGAKSHFDMLSNSNRRFIFVLRGQESGSNNGGDFSIFRYGDNGSYLGEVFRVFRNTGTTRFNDNLGIGGYSNTVRLYVKGHGNTAAEKHFVVTDQYNNEDFVVNGDGSVGIGATDTKGYKLAVGGKVVSEEVVVKLQTAWPDYVFETDYPLTPLEDLEIYLKENKHLPYIPTAKEAAEEGIKLGEMNAKLLEKVEELTLYIIEQNKTIKEQKTDLEEQENRLEKIEQQLKTLIDEKH